MFKGVFTALVTPFKDGQIDYPKIMNLVQRQLDAKINGVILTGTTGEGATISSEEKAKLYSLVIGSFKNKLTIIAGTGSNDTEETIRQSKIAEDCGVDGVLVVTPYYNKPSQKGLYSHYEQLAQNISCPIILYNVPGRTGVNLSPETVKELSSIKNIVALKEAGTFQQTIDTVRMNRKNISILSGDDFTFTPFMSLGGQGIISVASNAFPEMFVEIYDLAMKNDYEKANRLFYKIYPLIEMLFVESNPVPIKRVMHLLKLIENSSVRLPLVALLESNDLKLQKILKDLMAAKL